eukprot:6472043-Amphidinium_carterae.2
MAVAHRSKPCRTLTVSYCLKIEAPLHPFLAIHSSGEHTTVCWQWTGRNWVHPLLCQLSWGRQGD